MKDNYFKIEWIIDLILEQEPERKDLIEELNKIEIRSWIRQPYFNFVNGYNPNQEGSEWQFKENVVLEHETEGTIILDVLKGGRIGGVELVNQISD